MARLIRTQPGLETQSELELRHEPRNEGGRTVQAASVNNRDQKLAACGTIADTGATTDLTAPRPAGGADHALAAAEEVTAAEKSFLFELVNAAFYHRARVTWFACLHRVGMFLNILAGTAAVAFIKANPVAAILLALLLALISAANLAFDFAGLARKHEEARGVYHDLAAELEESDGDDATVKRLRARMIRSSATEPIMFEAADKVAFNAAIRSLAGDTGGEFVLTKTQRFLRHFWPYSGTKFLQRKDMPAASR